jgi:uncharacterized protein (DUF1810 family)
MTPDPYDLERFVKAQDPVIDRVYAELRSGRKQSHWMWFVFPQLRGLGQSRTSLAFGIVSLGEAQAYLAHPVLGQRLRECTRIATAADVASARRLFGQPDDMKFRSSMTLFALAAPGDADFAGALEKYFFGAFDVRTVEMLGAQAGS